MLLRDGLWATLVWLLAVVALQLAAQDASQACQGYDEMWGLCPDLPSCEECIPVDCEFSDWGEWYDSFGDCSGLRFHERTVALIHNECGKPCDGAKIESQAHVPERCLPKRVDCLLADWSPWSECQEAAGQAHRSRQILTQAGGGGEPCTGSTHETMPCGRGPTPVPCEFSPWQEWTACSSSCGNGRHTRMRSVLVESRHGGAACEGATLQTKPCELEECGGTDCVVGEWSQWSMCDTESHPQRYRKRQILRAATGAGRRCNQTLQETRGCPAREEQPCALSEWGEWRALGPEAPGLAACSQECGGGQAFRTRFVKEQPSGGASCPDSALREAKACNTQACSTSCKMAAWTEWAPCSVTCGRGTKTRARTLASPLEHFSEGCQGALEEALPCLGSEGECTHTDCLWSEWYEWSVCTATCGGGMTQRSRVIKSVPTGGGAACEALTKSEAAACATQPCGEVCIDGLWGDWKEWQACTATCSSGYAMRSRAVAREPNSCGWPVSGARHEYKACSHLPPCIGDADCELSEWSEWGFCSCTCYGLSERTRQIKVFQAGRGRHCDAPLKQSMPCNPAQGEHASPGCSPEPPTDCALGDWLEWTACSKHCGGGQRERHRKVVTLPTHGGRPCDGELSVTAPCNSAPCEMEECTDCTWGPWSEWGYCSRCRGERYRHRSIAQMPNHCGKMCDLGSSKEISNCTGQCEEALFCAWTEWSTPSGCVGAVCGHRTIMRSRALSLKPFDGDYLFAASRDSHCQGAQLNVSSCPATEACSPRCVPLDCVFTAWAEWETPGSSGLCERRRIVAATDNECGEPCIGPLVETKSCTRPRAGRRHCVLSEWANWGDCGLNGEVGQRHRSRAVVQLPSFDGTPCAATLEETEQCGRKGPTPVDCELSAWGLWDECARSCGGGWQSRARVLLARAADGGKPCEGSLIEMRVCNVVPCAFDLLDCLYSDWQVWSGCGTDGQRYRSRKVARPAGAGGTACTGGLEETQACEDDPKVDCVVSTWTLWSPCDKSCGGGQAQRQRQIMLFPTRGGAGCPSELMQTTGCNWSPCGSEDCLVGDWQAWDACAVSCGLGQQQRRREIIRTRSPDGAGCNLALSQVISCVGPPCPGEGLDCLWGDWSEWDGCTASCGGGQQGRTREIARMPSTSGRPCEAFDKQELRPCGTQACALARCQDGAWAQWSEWTVCSTTCGGGLRHRIREVATMANSCGSPALGDAREEEFCKVASCEPTYDCAFSAWEGWSDCTATCGGVKRRSRRISQYGSGEGQFCVGPLKETWPCNPGVYEPTPAGCSKEPPVDCLLSLWGDWSACSASCGGGERTRHREVLTPSANGGRQCEEHLVVVKQCSLAACLGPDPVDCQYGPWEEWGACFKCGGERTRFRHVLRYARHGGKPCEPFPAENLGACPRLCDEQQYCTWGEWAQWGECSARCGQGRRARRRYLGLTTVPSAPPDPVRDLAQRYAELRHVASELEARGGQEMLLAFAGGFLSFVLGLAAVRALVVNRGGLRAHGARSRMASDLYEAIEEEFELSELGAAELPLAGSL